MKPIDFRNQTFTSLSRLYLDGVRAALYYNLRDHGPATTRQLAARSGVDLLTVRPRVTELIQLGLVDPAGRAPHGGIYRAKEPAEVDAWLAQHQDSQLLML